MHWIHLTDEEQLEQIQTKSQFKPQVIFKHSTRCSISSVALQRLRRSDAPFDIDFYFLDLLAYRQLSNKVSDIFKVHHESPQILLIKDGYCIYDESHLGISVEEILEQVHALKEA
ncbi:MAG: bacillithiol system redox-active protein YtxJ [Chitinophagaceae bacterium]|nr:bacillithiol system redox-active protein YtxJ [Chitinophagaceae bacterium]